MNVEASEKFLTALDPAADRWTFQTFPDTDSPAPARVLHGTFSRNRTSLHELSTRGAGVFITVNETDGTGRSTENITRVRAVFADTDGAPLEPLLQAELEPHIVVESSPGKYHVYWLVSDFHLASFTPVQLALASRFGTDKGVADLPRVMRLPGFLHRKGEPFETRIITINDLPRYTPDDIDKLVEKYVDLDAEKDWKREAPIVHPYRHGYLRSWGAKLRNDGTDDLATELLTINARDCAPPKPETEVRDLAHYFEKKSEGYHLTDVGNARRFAEDHRQTARFCNLWNRWVLWDGTRWAKDESGAIVRRALDTVRGIYAEASKATDSQARKAIALWARQSETAGRIRSFLSLAESLCSIRPEDFDTDPMLLTVKNGTVDLRTGALREARRTDFITKQADVAHDLDATAPTWTRFLDRIFNGDTETIAFLQRALGYSLTGDNSEQCLFVGYGTGANGKSTLLETVKTILGDHGRVVRTDTIMAKRTDGIPNDIARLQGVRYGTAIETADGQRLNEALIKSLTGGDTVSARFLHAEFFDFEPVLKLWLAVNHKPRITGTDEGIWRRVRLIPFTVEIPESERDKNLKTKLLHEAPGILNWLIEGCRARQRDGLGTSKAVQRATAQYRSESDWLSEWLETLVDDPQADTPARDIYASYRMFCEAQGLRANSQTWLGGRLGEMGYQKVKTRDGIAYRGVKLADTQRGDF